jgi:hypothetical protein
MKYLFLFIMVVLSSFIGCEESAKPITSKNPYAKFSIIYDAAANSSTGSVFFWESSKDGKLIFIDTDEQLMYQDKSMQYQSSDRSYSLTLIGYSAQNTFKLVDLKKKEFVNTIVGSNIFFPVDAQYYGDTINTSMPVVFKWIGNPVDTNETITLTVENKIFTQDSLAATSIIIPKTEMEAFNGKSLLVRLERSKEKGLQQKPGSDGLISYLFKASPRKMYFKEGSAPLTSRNVYAEFDVVHDAVSNISTGSVQFWEGSKSGTSLSIDGSASLKFQNSALLVELGTNRYSGTINGYLSQYDFRFVDIDKKEYLNVITGNKISLPTTLVDTVNTSMPLKLAWIETAIGISEKVTLQIANKIFMQDTVNAKSISVPASELFVWKGTTQKVSIERLKVTSLQQKIGANGSGSISNRYIAQSKTLFFK